MIYLGLLGFINQFITRGHHLVEAFYLSFLLGTIFGNSTNMDDMQIAIPVFTHLHPGRTQFFVLGVGHVSKYPCHMIFSWQCIFPILSPDIYIIYIYIYYIYILYIYIYYIYIYIIYIRLFGTPYLADKMQNGAPQLCLLVYKP